MKQILLAASCFILITACSKKDSKAPEVKDLPLSIQTIIADAQKNCPVCGITLVMYLYNKEIVYGSVCNGPACNCFMIFYDEGGTIIIYEEEKYKVINAAKVLIKELYRCEG